MLGKLARLALRVTLVGVVLGAAAGVVGLGAIAVSELLNRRRGDDLDDDFGELDMSSIGGMPQELDEGFLALLACPVCKTSVRRAEDRLVCDTCGRRYPIRDGIPVMLVEEAEMPEAGAARTE